jgi:hypothetical protein
LVNEDLHAGEWIVTHLESDTGVGGLFNPSQAEVPSGVYRDLIPANRDLPAIRFHLQNPLDVRTVGQARVIVQLDYLIVVIREGHGVAPLLPLADRVDELLHGANGTTSTVTIYECTRLEPFHLLEPDDSGVQYRHAGGIYRIMAQAK